ncbi:MAG TPA: aminopeptidase P family N-terminal domain-containing protein, partial [Alphaproteobacteria bacterium]|nr:aminopeptidase P family N-terminal domain-containing protein [Alphaproteobacteria bacterium]
MDRAASKPNEKTACRAAYQGDEPLARLLRKHGIETPVAELRDLVAGVAAAPEAEDRAAWTRLVTAQPSAALTAQLLALEAELRAEMAKRAQAGPGFAERLALLRAALARRGLAGFIVPRGDEHQGEYVPPSAERLAWLTGFTGSAGAAIVLADKAAIFVDGRYTLQARAQVDAALFEQRHLIETPPWTWLKANAPRDAAIGYDPWLHSANERLHYAAALEAAGAKLVASETNPLDEAWRDRPPAPLAPIVPHGIEHAGQSSAEKRAQVAGQLASDGVDAAVLTAPDSIAWLLNIRGGDVPHTPLPLSFAIVARDGRVELFSDPRKLSPGLDAWLGNEVTVRPRADFAAALDGLGGAQASVLADPASCSAFVLDRLERAGARVKRGADPVSLPKACKNAVELAGARAVHLRDGAALTRFLAWVKRAGAEGRVGEIEAAERLHDLRRAGDKFRDLSFATISGAGPNGAIVHYRVTAESERKLEPGELYLVDSGAQYLDGTTDVTRTLAIGAPSAEMRDRFTRVLKGHIALALARFPEGTTGAQL